MSFVLNGNDAVVRRHHPHLLSALRDELGVISPKDGCAPSGQCGCCVVLVNGRAVTSCTQSVESVEGKEVVTLEGVDDAEVDRYARAFASRGALQCGFCTPGIVMRTKALLDAKGKELKRDEAARFLGTHLCRCTGYV
jgi:xanthine dehydrogenase molybdenum-binding subunit